MLKLSPELTEKVKNIKQLSAVDKTKLENEIIESIRDKNNKNYSKMLDSFSDAQLRQMLNLTLSIINTN